MSEAEIGPVGKEGRNGCLKMPTLQSQKVLEYKCSCVKTAEPKIISHSNNMTKHSTAHREN